MMDYVRAHPGVHFRALQRAMGVGNGAAVHHLRALERARLLRAQRERLHVRFYAAGQPTVLERVPSAGLSARQLALLDHVAARPGCTQSAAAEALGVSRQALHYHVRALQERGWLDVQPQGARDTALRLAPTAASALRRCEACGHRWLAPDAGPAACPRGPHASPG